MVKSLCRLAPFINAKQNPTKTQEISLKNTDKLLIQIPRDKLKDSYIFLERTGEEKIGLFQALPMPHNIKKIHIKAYSHT